jgi:hypothetical protein
MTSCSSLPVLPNAVRIRLCPRCPKFRPTRTQAQAFACERSCDLFAHLARLARIAVARDPMLAEPQESMQHEIDAILDESALQRIGPKSHSQLYHFRDELAAIIAQSAADAANRQQEIAQRHNFDRPKSSSSECFIG